MAFTNIINDAFPNAKGCKTEAGAFARIKRAQDCFSSEDFNQLRFFVLQRPDGTYIAVCSIGSVPHAISSLIHLNICVIN